MFVARSRHTEHQLRFQRIYQAILLAQALPLVCVLCMLIELHVVCVSQGRFSMYQAGTPTEGDREFSAKNGLSSVRLPACILTAGLIATFLSCLLSTRFLRKHLGDRLAVLEANCIRLTHGLPLLEPVSGMDEIAFLDKKFRCTVAAMTEAIRLEEEALDGINDAILTIDDSLIVKSANRSAADLCGLGTQIINSSVLTLIPEELHLRVKLFFEQVKQAGETRSFEVPLASSLDCYISISISAQWSADDQLFACIFHDITERKQAEDALRESEAHLRSMIQRMSPGMVLLDQMGHIIAANSTAAELLSTQEATLRGQLFSNVLPMPDKTTSELEWLEAAARERQSLLVLSQPKDAKHLELMINKLSFSTNEKFLILLQDITAKQNVELLRHHLLDGMMQKILAPLDSIHKLLIRLFSAVEKNEGEYVKYLSVAVDESYRLLKLFGDLIEIEQSNIQQLSINKREVSVAQIMERSLEAMRVIAEKKGVALSHEPTPDYIYADPDRIVQLLINLIFNALKFTTADGYVRLESEIVSENTIELRTVDSGCGIPAGKEKEIFEPFKQATVGDHLLKGGSGLGLFICKSIAEKHGGTIDASNHANGAVFSVRLPVDDMKARRLADYEALKLVDAGRAIAFGEATGLLDFEPGLSDSQRWMLDVMGSHNTEHTGFSEYDPKLLDSRAMHHQSHSEIPEMDLPVKERILRLLARVDKAHQKVVLSNSVEQPPAQRWSKTDAPDSVTSMVKSLFSTGASTVANQVVPTAGMLRPRQYDRLKLVTKSYSNIAQPLESISQQQSASQPIGTTLSIAFVVAIAVPLILVSTWYGDSRRGAEQVDALRAATLMARDVIVEKSYAGGAQQPFSMPAPENGQQSGSSNIGTGQPAPGSQARHESISPYGSPKAEQTSESLTASQQEEISRQIRLGDKYLADGNAAAAAETYLVALTKYPNHIKLRIITIRAYLTCHNWAAARQLCVEGLKIAPEDVNLRVLLEDIPRD